MWRMIQMLLIFAKFCCFQTCFHVLFWGSRKIKFQTKFTCQFKSINWLMFMQSFVAIIVTANVTVTVTIIIPSNSNGNIAFRSSCIIYAIFACESFSTEIKQINELCVVRHDLRFIPSPNTSLFFSLNDINIYIFMSVHCSFLPYRTHAPAHPFLSHFPIVRIVVIVSYIFCVHFDFDRCTNNTV